MLINKKCKIKIMDYLNELIEITHKNAQKIGLTALVVGSTLAITLGVASYAHSRLNNESSSRFYAGLATLSLATTTLGVFILREERYYSEDNSPKHQRV